MSKAVKPSEISNAIKTYLEDYREDIQDDVVEVTDKVTKEAVKELKENSPKGQRGAYAKGWSTKIQKRGKLKYHKVIWNKTNYQLTHLLEFGHEVHNTSTRAKAIPHIRQVEEKYNQEFVDLLETKIRRTK